MKENTLCFTGHRYYSGGPDDGARLDAALCTAYGDGYRTFISGMAEGFDLAAAEAVVRLRRKCPGVKLIAALPFRGQAAGYSPDNRKLYDTLLAEADRVVLLSEKYFPGCYYRRDDWMVDSASRVVCWYDGSGSGTRYTVRYALRRGLGIVNLYREQACLFQ